VPSHVCSLWSDVGRLHSQLPTWQSPMCLGLPDTGLHVARSDLPETVCDKAVETIEYINPWLIHGCKRVGLITAGVNNQSYVLCAVLS